MNNNIFMLSSGNFSPLLKSVGVPISGGDYVGYPMSQAFDGNYDDVNIGSYWVSAQGGAGVSGVSYIGRDFKTEQIIKTVRFNQSVVAGNSVSSIKYKTSANGSTWVDVQTFSVTTGINVLNLAVPSKTRFFALLANSGCQTGYYWFVRNIEVIGIRLG